MQISVPWVSAVFGASQYELLLAAFLENLAEPCSFGPKQAPPIPVGRRPPPVPPQPQVAPNSCPVFAVKSVY
jgi:hypothetical protein